MPQITAITEQKKNKLRKKSNKGSRFNIFIDGKYAFSLGEELLLRSKLKEGADLESKQIESIKKEDLQVKLLDKAVNFLSYRPRSEKEIKDYLIKTISKTETIKWAEAKESSWPDLVITKLKKYGYVDDEAFAKWWVESRSKARPKGRRLISLELKKKGIDEELVEKFLPKEEKTDLGLALKVLDKKKSTLSKLSPQEVKKKAFYYLASRGFDFDTIKEAFAIFTKKD